MTDEQKYSELLKAIGETLQNKNAEIAFLTYENGEMKRKLLAVENLIESLRERACKCDE